jgi:hypothetical protein
MLSILICINIKDEVETSQTLDRYSIIEIISKYNKDLAREINKMNIYKIEHPKPKNSIKPLRKLFEKSCSILHYMNSLKDEDF